MRRHLFERLIIEHRYSYNSLIMQNFRRITNECKLNMTKEEEMKKKMRKMNLVYDIGRRKREE